MRDRILHLADLHLGDRHSFVGHRSAERAREADSILRRIVDDVLGNDSRVAGVIIAGDLFDHYAPEATLVEEVRKQLQRLVDGGILLLTVPGNHDELSYPNCAYRELEDRWPGTLATSPSATKVAEWTIADVDIDLYAMAFVAGRSKAPFDAFDVENPDRFNVAVFHGSLDLQSGDRSVPLSSRELQKLNLDYIALGHLHTPSERKLGSGKVAYCGRIEGSSFRDPGGAPLLEVEVTPSGPVLHRTKVLGRTIETVEVGVGTCMNEDEVDQRLQRIFGDHDEDRIVRARLVGSPGFVVLPEVLQTRWKDRFYHFEVEGPGTPLSDSDLEELATEPTVRGRFVRIALEKIETMQTERERQVAQLALREGLTAFSGTGVGARQG